YCRRCGNGVVQYTIKKRTKPKQVLDVDRRGGIYFFYCFFRIFTCDGTRIDRVGQLATAIVIAVIFRQIFGYPEAIRSGIAFSSKRLLRAAIILYGLKLNIDTVLSDGLGLLAVDAGVIVFSIFAMIWLAKRFK